MVAVIGQCTATSSPASARQLGKASIAFSVIGVVLLVVIIVGVVVLGFTFTDVYRLMPVSDYKLVNLKRMDGSSGGHHTLPSFRAK